MTAPVQQLLDSFDALPESERHQAGVEIIRRLTGEGRADVPDSALIGIADDLFRTLDEEETGHAPR